MARKILLAVLPLLIIISFSFFAVKPLFYQGFFTHHDDQHVARLFELNKALVAGQFPVRLVPDLGFGLGYAVFNFYPPLAYYTGEVFHLLGFGFIDSIKLVWLIAILGSGITMFFLAKKYFGNVGGVVSSLFYVYAPYHAIDAYVRGALAELYSFVWLPLILLFADRPVISGFFLALLMITHNLIFLPFVGLYILWSRNIKNVVVSLLVAFGLTAFFWLPSLWEKQFTLVDDLLIKNLASYKIHFVCPSQLWDSLWGYGGSIAGCIDGMSFKLGKLHIIIALLAFVIALIKKSKVVLISSLLFTLSVFMTTKYSSFIWDRIPQLWYLQFPWRFLEFAALFSSLIAGSFAVVVASRVKQSLIGLFLILTLLFFNAKLFIPQTFTSATDADLTSDAEIIQRVSSTSFEYLPKGSPIKATDYKNINVLPNQLPITAFPGWKVYLNGQEVKYTSDNKFRLITLDFPVTGKDIIAKFTDTPIRSIGNFVSLIWFLSLGSWFLLKYGFKRFKK